eukprot:TRINITY_DN3555_c0_g1_i7.p1 TRINITY_DN3555_c0_g1~~TRINITY_DN3555_c0_g1_i7.p1  ORF type:complete len:500 (-),score=119.97 TRINITY_DN3555_c0_g1_i7:147-1646(-)
MKQQQQHHHSTTNTTTSTTNTNDPLDMSFDATDGEYKKRKKRTAHTSLLLGSSSFSELQFLLEKPDTDETHILYRKRFGWAEMRGRRPDMQDTISLYDHIGRNKDHVFLSCFDGHSGEKSAEFVAKRILSVFTKHFTKYQKKFNQEMHEIKKKTKKSSDSLETNKFPKTDPGVHRPRSRSLNDEYCKPVSGSQELMSSSNEDLTSSGKSKSTKETRTRTKSKEAKLPKLIKSSAPKQTNSTPLSKKKLPKNSNILMLSEDLYIEIFNETFKELHNSIRTRRFDDGAAAVVALIQHDVKKIIIANAGDQRVVLARGKLAVPITTDHKPNEPTERIRIYRTGGYVSEHNRVNGILALSRSLGDSDLQPHVTYEPDVFFVDLKPDDKFLIVACDGLWDVVSNQTAVDIVYQFQSPVKAATALRDYAYALGSGDNISVIVYMLIEPKQADNGDVDAVPHKISVPKSKTVPTKFSPGMVDDKTADDKMTTAESCQDDALSESVV